MGEGAMYTVSLSEPFWWKKIGKVANQAKLAIPSHSEPLLWEKIGKVANQAKLAIPSHSEPLLWEKIGKVANQMKLAILSHFSGKRLEKTTQTKSNFPYIVWGRWGSSPSTSPAENQKVEHNPKMSISSFFGWRRVVDGVRVQISI